MPPLIRRLAHSPSFTVPAILGLALAIGATTAVFSVFSAMMLRPMGIRDAARVAALWRSDEGHGQKKVEVSYGDLLDWQRVESLAGVALLSSVNLDFPILVNAVPEHVDGTTVSGNFFDVLGASPFAGRLFTADDDRPSAPARVVLSHRLWRTRFGDDYGIIGREIHVGPGTATVIGIARPEFDFPRMADLWVPIHASWPDVDKSLEDRVFSAVARFKPGTSPEQARTQLSAVPARTPGAKLGVVVTPILDEIYGAARPAVRILLGAVFLVLLIACANAANLLMNRAMERGKELAVRAALGASRIQITRLLVTESLTIAAVAGLLGLALASAGVELLVRLAPSDVPRIEQASIDLPVLLFGFAVTLATVLFFGVGPAWIASKRDANDALKESGRGTSGSVSQARLRGFLIAAEVALSVVLLVCAGSLVRTFQKMAAVDPEFKPERILTFRVTTDSSRQESRRALYTQILDHMRVLPGVDSAAAILIRPLSGDVGWDAAYTVQGEIADPRHPNPNGNYEAVSTDYFRTMGIRLISGRDFTIGDSTESPNVAIIDQTTALRHWPNGNAVGHQIRLNGPKAAWLNIVGVVAQVRDREWESERPDIYVPYTQRAQHRSDFVVKTYHDPWLLAETVRREVFAVDKNQPISNVTTMQTLVDHALARPKFNSAVMAALASCALLLAVIGIYGVLAYAVTQRTAEIAIRAALGATPASIARLIAVEGMRVILAGLAAGLMGAMWARNLLSAILFQADGLDASAFAAAACALIVFAAAACLVPAARAASVDPVQVLR